MKLACSPSSLSSSSCPRLRSLLPVRSARVWFFGFVQSATYKHKDKDKSSCTQPLHGQKCIVSQAAARQVRHVGKRGNSLFAEPPPFWLFGVISMEPRLSVILLIALSLELRRSNNEGPPSSESESESESESKAEAVLSASTDFFTSSFESNFFFPGALVCLALGCGTRKTKHKP